MAALLSGCATGDSPELAARKLSAQQSLDAIRDEQEARRLQVQANMAKMMEDGEKWRKEHPNAGTYNPDYAIQSELREIRHSIDRLRY